MQTPLRDVTREIQVVIGSDNVILRDLLEFRISKTPGIKLAGSGALGVSLVDLIGQLIPDVTILTLKLGFSSEGEMELIRAIRAENSESRLITLAPTYLPRQLAALGQYGVAGILLESQGWQALTQAIQSVHIGDFFTTQSVAGSVLGLNLQREIALTDHEIRLMELVSKGLSNNEIANLLNVSESTVRSRLSNVLGKLNVANRTQAVTESIRLGYVEPCRPCG